MNQYTNQLITAYMLKYGYNSVTLAAAIKADGIPGIGSNAIRQFKAGNHKPYSTAIDKLRLHGRDRWTELADVLDEVADIIEMEREATK